MKTLFGMLGAQQQEDLLKALASEATYGTSAASLVKEDLEVEAHTQLYQETDEAEFVLLKHIPHIQATNVLHQFAKITGYGGLSHEGFYAENSLPPQATMQSVPATTTIRLLGAIASTTALASFQTSIGALGQNNLVDENVVAARLNVLHKIAVATYAADDSVTTHFLRFKGLRQQILEGTSPSTSAPYTVNTDYIIDLRGAKLTPQEIRKRARQVMERHGAMRGIYMAPSVSEFLEASLDAAERINIGQDTSQPVMLGQRVSGMRTMGIDCRFWADNTLTSSLYAGIAPLTAESNAPAPLPGGNIGTPTVAPNGGSLWVAADADAAVLYQFTALNAAGGESTATAITPIAVAAGDGVTIAITPRAADTGYRVYRGSSTVSPPRLIREIKGTGNATPFNFVDLNERIPGTTEAFGLNILSSNLQALTSMNRPVTLANRPLARNTCALVTLGPWMGSYELGPVLHTTNYDLIFSACAPQVTHPYQNVCWINVGDR